MKKTLITSSVLASMIIIASGIMSATAAGGCVTPPNGWSGPGSTPPSGNVCPPINTGTSWQIKVVTPGTGGIGIGSGATQLANGVLNVVGGAFFTGGAVTDTLVTGGLQLISGTTVKNNIMVDTDGHGTAGWVPLSSLNKNGAPTTNVLIQQDSSQPLPANNITLSSDSDVYLSAQAGVMLLGGSVSGGGMNPGYSRVWIAITVDGKVKNLYDANPFSGNYAYISGSYLTKLIAGNHTVSMKVMGCDLYGTCEQVDSNGRAKVSATFVGFII